MSFALIGAVTSVVMSLLGLVGWVSTVRQQDRARQEGQAAKERQRVADLAAARAEGREEKARELTPDIRRLESDLAQCKADYRESTRRIQSLEDMLFGRRLTKPPPDDEG